MRRAPKFAVIRHPYVASGTDDEGNTIAGFGPDEPVLVHGVYPYSSSETGVFDRDVTRLNMIVPDGFESDRMDNFTVYGQRYGVDGHVADYCDGPFDYRPGGIVSLKLAEG